jgi:hypothetical protein
MRNEDIHQDAPDRTAYGGSSTSLWYCVDKCSRIGEPCLLVNPLSAVKPAGLKNPAQVLERGDSGTAEMIRVPR